MDYKIGITGTGSLIGQAIIKSIKKSSFKTSTLIGMDYFENTIGSYWTDKNYLLPDILKGETSIRSWVEEVIEIITSEHLNIIFVGVDFELSIFSTHKSEIEEKTNCIIMVSDLDTIRIGDDKYLTYEFLKGHSLYYPKTYTEYEIDTALLEIDFPMIVKPRNGYRSVNVFLVNNEIELRRKIISIKNPIIQEYIGDKTSEFTCGTICFNKKVKKSIVLRRDLKDGNTSTTYLDGAIPPIITTYIENASSALGQFGVCNFQLRIDKQGLPKIFEINSRHSGTTYIRSLYGYNEIEYILEYIFNNRELSFSLKQGTVKRYFEEFFIENKL
jgi:carbamoyl-phosphate synthase large subunit